ncbi:saccharopine dehydrogenase [Mycobacterium sp. CBMA 234]|uniref:saccharopine dehydrogenase NADP-binding domain-containing protein n=1 Tax=Mycolicibacterium sp. CBMA 234 TaxID=1918495 RepID=UPI0012DDE780|nr:saccharopine dehydrogenase NADP-binding domain-containing protein [Mycolicibacterium sp. CBMA 234]MUL62956.1 saccharopine dehydrogenase [Mycolicibacterium sp. CBMA 234]
MQTIWILGATGKGGRAIASELIGGDADVVLVGRDRDRLAAVATALGGQSRTLVASGPTELATLIASEKPTVAVNTIGPFGETSALLAHACVVAGTHYVDLANELPPVLAVLGMDGDARRNGVTLVTGAGFGVLATEALVIELATDRAPAARATVAAMPTVDGLGSAVLSSVIDAVGYGGRRYRGGQLQRTRLGADHARIPLPDLPAIEVLSVPTGELEAARRASGAGDVVAFSSEVPSGRAVRAAMPILSAVLAVRPIRDAVQRLVSRARLTPPAKTGDVSWAYARLEWPDGTHREAWLRTGEGYTFTAKVAAQTAARLGDGRGLPGAFTPGAHFGADLARDAGAQIITSVVAS